MNRLLFLLPLLAFFASCSKKKDTSDPASIILQEKTWRMTTYFDDGIDHLSNFTGYAFTFNADNTISAVKNGVTEHGIWKDSVIIDGDSVKVEALYMRFADTKPFKDLTANWEVVSKDKENVHLRKQDNPKTPYDEIYFKINK